MSSPGSREERLKLAGYLRSLAGPGECVTRRDEQVAAFRRAAELLMEAPNVKPLEWLGNAEKGIINSSEYDYWCEEIDGKWGWGRSDLLEGLERDLEDAKQACQDHYNAACLAPLVPHWEGQ